LTWGDVDLEGHAVRLQGKGGDERAVPLGKPCVEALSLTVAGNGGIVAPTERVFPGLTTQNIRDRLKVVGRRIGVRLTPHLFRHAFTTHMLNQGANLRAVQEMLGHKSVCSTFIYWDSTDKHITQMLREIYMYLPRARAYLMAHPDCFSDLYDYRESP
jgi:site-specific recombinase XerD